MIFYCNFKRPKVLLKMTEIDIKLVKSYVLELHASIDDELAFSMQLQDLG